MKDLLANMAIDPSFHMRNILGNLYLLHCNPNINSNLTQDFKLGDKIIHTEAGNYKVRKNGKRILMIGGEMIRVEGKNVKDKVLTEEDFSKELDVVFDYKPKRKKK